jgi:HTH-type transcriptional regulator/antitoxin HipB
MDYPVATSGQLRTVLRALRQAQHLSQTQAGLRLGVSQKRLARIEANPGVTGFDQIARLVSALGGRLVITMPPTRRPAGPTKAKDAANANTW